MEAELTQRLDDLNFEIIRREQKLKELTNQEVLLRKKLKIQYINKTNNSKLRLLNDINEDRINRLKSNVGDLQQKLNNYEIELTKCKENLSMAKVVIFSILTAVVTLLIQHNL